MEGSLEDACDGIVDGDWAEGILDGSLEGILDGTYKGRLEGCLQWMAPLRILAMALWTVTVKAMRLTECTPASCQERQKGR